MYLCQEPLNATAINSNEFFPSDKLCISHNPCGVGQTASIPAENTISSYGLRCEKKQSTTPIGGFSLADEDFPELGLPKRMPELALPEPATGAPKRARHDGLQSLLSRLGDEEDEPAHEDVAPTVPSASTVTSMDREALRNLWQQIGSLGPLRKNASEKTMRRAIKAHIRSASH